MAFLIYRNSHRLFVCGCFVIAILAQVSQNNIQIQILGIQLGDLSALQGLVVSLFNIISAHFLTDHVIPVGQLVKAGEVHNVVAVFGGHDAGVANLTIGVNTPI